MRRLALVRIAPLVSGGETPAETERRRLSHHWLWSASPADGARLRIAPVERQGPFCGELARYVPTYDLIKAWALLQAWPSHAGMAGAPPSLWPEGWRPRFVRALQAGRWPELYQAGEPGIDRTLKPAARLAAWAARCPVVESRVREHPAYPTHQQLF